MDRRTFSRYFGALTFCSGAFGHYSAAASRNSRADPFRDAQTFTQVGKEEQPFVEKKEADLATHSGSGYLDHMWFGGAFPDYLRLRIRVYVDHESTSSIDTELGLGAGVGFGDSDAPWGTQFSGITGSPSGVFLNYRIPFRSHIRVTAELPSGVSRDTVLWWIVRGAENLPLEVSGIHLPETARLRLHKAEDLLVQPFEEFDLCRVNGSGMVFQVTVAARSANYNYIEGQMRAYMSGKNEPQFLSSGLEDYFLGTYGFNRGLYHLPQAGLTHRDEKDNSFSAYRFHVIDPIFFTSGMRLACRCGERRGAKVFGEPMPTTYTTYVWTYEW
jgi:hypothetical protein